MYTFAYALLAMHKQKCTWMKISYVCYVQKRNTHNALHFTWFGWQGIFNFRNKMHALKPGTRLTLTFLPSGVSSSSSSSSLNWTLWVLNAVIVSTLNVPSPLSTTNTDGFWSDAIFLKGSATPAKGGVT